MDSKPTQVLHVRENSDSELEALFKVLYQKDGTTPGQIPYSMRKLPASFFTPPDQKTGHSRESSNDSTSNPQNSNNAAFVLHQASGLNINHPRAHSSPANLQQSLAVASSAPPQGPPHHARQPSFDIAEDNTPLPPGWEMAKTPDGQRYFLNHMEQLTTWQDPRKTLSNTTAIHQNLANIPMPYGWEQANTPEGEPYFINHVEKATSWFDPRLPAHLQRPGVLGSHARSSSSPVTHGSHPQSHRPSHAQQQQQSQSGEAQTSPPGPPGQPGQPPRAFQLQQLQLEKERLRKRQEELARQNCVLSFQEMLLRTTIQEENVTTPVSTSGGDSASERTSGATSSGGSGVDPFAQHSNNNNSTDFHTRQESADSGLGGMGTNFGHSKTPEDFLSNVDEMDTHDGGPVKLQAGAQSGGATHYIGASVDLNSIADQDVQNMDSEELVPSLQEDISNELLNDVDSVLNRDSLLTWL